MHIETKHHSYFVQIKDEDQFWRLDMVVEKIISESNSNPENAEKFSYKIPKESYIEVEGIVSFIFKDQSYLVDIFKTQDMSYLAFCRSTFRHLKITSDIEFLKQSFEGSSRGNKVQNLTAGMPGKVVDILVSEGDSLSQSTPLIIVEAMKMENEIRAPKNLVVKSIHVKRGQEVSREQPLLSFI